MGEERHGSIFVIFINSLLLARVITCILESRKLACAMSSNVLEMLGLVLYSLTNWTPWHRSEEINQGDSGGVMDRIVS